MIRRPLLALALALAVPGLALAHDDDHRPGGDISRVNGGITAESGQAYGDLDTVNGGISIHSGARAEDVNTVNGGISLDDDAQVGSVDAVNGGITAGERVKVVHDAGTVNGGIRFDFYSSVGGDVSTVNGGITVKKTQVKGRIKTVNGDITVGNGSVIGRGILIEKPHGISWGKVRVPRVIIGPNAVVNGELRFEREVELYVHTSAKIGAVTGATAKPYTDTIPARRD